MRLLEIIERRNAIRKGAGLPLLPIAQEYRRMKEFEAAKEFADFAELFQGRLVEKVIAKRQRIDPNWKPRGFFGGMAIQVEVSQRLKRLYLRVGR